MNMMAGGKAVCPIILAIALAFPVWSQTESGENQATDQKQERKHEPGAAREIGAGAGTAGVGVAKGAGDAAKGAAKGAGDLVTLHPVDAATSVGKGAATAGKDVTVGAAKGTGKITRGIGRVFKKLF
jgi:hypothetical protein